MSDEQKPEKFGRDTPSIAETIELKPYLLEFEVSPGHGPVWNLNYEKHLKNFPSHKACLEVLIENLEADLVLIKAHLEDLNEIDF